MISLSSELTDTKGRRASSGWVFFDGSCPFCTSMVRRFAPVLKPRGYGFAPLQDPRVQELLALPPEQLLLEMRVLTPAGQVLGGADAVVFLAREIWWAWPLFVIAHLPGMRPLLHVGYRWIAARRSCSSGACAVASTSMSARKAK
jgi:predicted DCC family thiol-disulfide oxidoreductase YuxK